ncbi:MULTISPECIES: alpha/beta hydrolase [Streptomyces]|uniref:alpha/beta hydrolase n=1 Tax=Streptomyces TaxID=1883 RepID=UPI0019CB7607|nr:MULTISPECIES: alpha/beta fold hydrolase [Streptomyces]UFR05192.1 alpha/beta fold hydrolase [Streptomyces sp. Go40/10]GGT03956.1 thioesterase [Streptomyces cinerochromogenes]
MPQSSRAAAPASREIVLDALGVPVSGLLAEPSSGAPRAVVVALHGGGIRAGYFDGHTEPGHSLLELGADLGFTVLALDRPGYGESAPFLPEGLGTQEQAMLLRAALRDFARTHGTGDGFFVVAHSNGAKPGLAMAAQDHEESIIGLDVSGLGSTPAAADTIPRHGTGRMDWYRHWGDPGLYPAGTFRRCRALLAPIPAQEIREFPLWPDMYPGIAASVRAPVRFTFAEQEPWWRSDARAVADLTAPLASTRVRVDHQPDAGHNISLGWAARAYHLRVLAFLEECLLTRRTTAAPLPAPSPGDTPAAADGMPATASWQFLTRVMFPLALAPDLP